MGATLHVVIMKGPIIIYKNLNSKRLERTFEDTWNQQTIHVKPPAQFSSTETILICCPLFTLSVLLSHYYTSELFSLVFCTDVTVHWGFVSTFFLSFFQSLCYFYEIELTVEMLYVTICSSEVMKNLLWVSDETLLMVCCSSLCTSTWIGCWLLLPLSL